MTITDIQPWEIPYIAKMPRLGRKSESRGPSMVRRSDTPIKCLGASFDFLHIKYSCPVYVNDLQFISVGHALMAISLNMKNPAADWLLQMTNGCSYKNVKREYSAQVFKDRTLLADNWESIREECLYALTLQKVLRKSYWIKMTMAIGRWREIDLGCMYRCDAWMAKYQRPGSGVFKNEKMMEDGNAMEEAIRKVQARLRKFYAEPRPENYATRRAEGKNFRESHTPYKHAAG